MKPNRGLSLTDLVNHDDTPPLKTDNVVQPQANVQIVSVPEATQPGAPAVGPAVPVSGSNFNNSSASQGGLQSSSAFGPGKAAEESDETDTDDEPGEIVFANTKFKFDDEEPSVKKSPAKKPTVAKEKETQVKKEPEPEPRAESKAEVKPEVKPEVKAEPEIKSKPEEKVEIQPKPQTSLEQDDKTTPSSAAHAKKENNDIFKQKSSNASVKNNIKKDLMILNELSSSSLPKRYNIPPIWARKWKPTVKALQAIDSKNLKLDDSILSFIPEDDLTKSVQDWIYATLVSVEPQLRQFVEIEMKYGVIIDPTSSSRVNPPVSSQCVFTDLDSTMKPDVDERVFDEFNRYMRNLSELNENMGKFNIIESHTSDLSYRVRTHTERPKFLRMTKDVNTGRIAQFIEKRKISQLLLYSPKDSYDCKISISLELPVPESDPPEKYSNHTPTGNRIKKRTSYIHNDSCTRFDITKVENKPVRVNNNKKDRNEEPETTYEVELEINTPALLEAYDNIQHDSKQYAAIVRTFLNNGTIVRRKLSSLSYDIFQGSNKL